MPKIRNLDLIKRFTDYFKLKFTDSLDSEAGRTLIPVVMLPVPPKILQLNDILANDSDKNFIVPAGRQWKLLYGHIILTTTASAGNRRIRFILEDADGNRLYLIDAILVQVASTTERYSLGQFGEPLENVAAVHHLPIPVNVILPENFRIHILDSAAIDAAADDLTLRLIVEETDITGE